ncbi:MAG: UDP-N-acetylmuramoyl-tripeptide--D-alanyl-D-alanine ligase [Vicinamibacteria bacterium]|nr:UDP-N-acetylmuramoyl-tripeptide--D-alanyl-D-alanine ligase [Vicinamibacteria bacterium]
MRILETVSWAEIAQALGARAEGVAERPARGGSIDTRTLEAGDIFFALKGEQVDGHDHLLSALEKGASCAVVSRASRAPRGLFCLIVDDPETALFEMGRLLRGRSSAVFVAITGSAGKTTAKEFTASVLSAQGPVLATSGNLNNHLGVPLTLMRLETDHWAAVIECGMSHAGELSRLARLVKPKVAAVTNVAAAHLEFFDSIEQIAEAKTEIFETLQAGDTAVAPADEPLLSKPALLSAGSARLFGEGDRALVRARGISMSLEGSNFQLESEGSLVSVSLPVPGPHAISNFLVAAAIATALGLSIETIADRARFLKSPSNRGMVKRLQDDILLIDDSYNSNPLALVSAVETLALAIGRRRVACLGDMLELGPSGPKLHRDAGAAIGPQIDLLLGVGTLAREILIGASSLSPLAKRGFDHSADLAAQIGDLVQSHDAVLVKGSRGVRMERVVEALEAVHPGVAS